MKHSKNRKNRIVYSTEHGKMCSGCAKPSARCECGIKSHKPQNDGVVRISRATKGRKGKGVMVISGVPLNASELKNLGKELKGKFGVGGAVKNGIIELQGDFRERLAEELSRHGWKVKISGG